MPSTTTFSKADVVADLKRDEGIRSRPYRDSKGFLTIGVGHNLDAAGLCEAAIEAQLEFDIAHTITQLDANLPWWSSQPPDIQRVLINLCFNMGPTKLLTFSTTLRAIREGRYADAANSLGKTLYAKQVGPRAARLCAILRAEVRS